MTLHLGTVRPGSTLYIPFASYGGAAGESITLTGLAVTDIEIFKNGSATTRASDTGYALLDTDGIDFAGITGVHGFSLALSSNATAGFFTAGAFYWVVVSAVTIDTQTVNFIAATFTIGYPDALLNTTIATLASQTSFTLTDGPAEADALNGCVAVIHDIASAVQLAKVVILDYAVTSKTVTLAAAPSFTVQAGDNISIFVQQRVPVVTTSHDLKGNGTRKSAAVEVFAVQVSCAGASKGLVKHLGTGVPFFHWDTQPGQPHGVTYPVGLQAPGGYDIEVLAGDPDVVLIDALTS